jgi:hypothetical protein
MNRSWSIKSGSKVSKINYNIININDSTKEKLCINADKENEKKYRLFCERAAQTSKKWENSGAKMNLEVPKPPKPNNYERLIEFKRKHVLRPAIEQSKATLYLARHGYELEKDYEAYQAIELANSLKNYSKDLKKQKNAERRKTRLDDMLNVRTMTLSRTTSNSSIDIDEFCSRTDDSSPTDSSTSGEESLCNSMEFKKQSELLDTINEFKVLEKKNNTISNDLLPIISAAPSAPPALPVPSAPPASRTTKLTI